MDANRKLEAISAQIAEVTQQLESDVRAIVADTSPLEIQAFDLESFGYDGNSMTIRFTANLPEDYDASQWEQDWQSGTYEIQLQRDTYGLSRIE